MKCSVLVVLFALAASTQARPDDSHHLSNHAGSPREGYEMIGDHEYYLGVEDRVTWAEALVRCNNLGMKLVSLEEEEKNLLIKEHLIVGYPFGQMWTSGQRFAGSWLWSGLGQAFNLTDWGEGQPDVREPEVACVNVRGWYGWYDDPCTAIHHYLCE